MLRKPSYCCNCGDKVERLEWHIWNSRKFCELCETEFQFDEWWPRIGIAIILIFGITGIGFHYGGGRAEADFAVESIPDARDSGAKTASANTVKPSVSKQTNVYGAELAEDSAPPAEVKPEPIKGMNPPRKSAAQRKEAPEEIVYCGAMTKKGTPCARRVKGGGRCWQHKDQE